MQQRVRLDGCNGAANPCVDTSTRQTDAAVLLQEDWRPFDELRIVAGLRSDLFEWDVRPNGNGLNGSDRLTAATVFDDGAVDTMTGDAGLDWFFAGATDQVTSSGNETTTFV